MTDTQDYKITKELQEVLKKHPKIEKVYFDDEGNYHFNKHEIEIHIPHESGEFKGFSKSVKKVQSLPGATRGLIKTQRIVNGRPEWKDTVCNTDYKPIAYELNRDEILSVKVSLSLSTEEKVEIMLKAAEISKDTDFQNVLAAINKKSK